MHVANRHESEHKPFCMGIFHDHAINHLAPSFKVFSQCFFCCLLMQSSYKEFTELFSIISVPITIPSPFLYKINIHTIMNKSSLLF